MQAQVAKAQEELKSETVEASAGGGAVTVKATGALEIVEIRIAPGGDRPGRPELLADMVLAAVNEALRSAQASRSRSSAPRWAGSPGSACPGCSSDRRRYEAVARRRPSAPASGGSPDTPDAARRRSRRELLAQDLLLGQLRDQHRDVVEGDRDPGVGRCLLLRVEQGHSAWVICTSPVPSAPGRCPRRSSRSPRSRASSLPSAVLDRPGAPRRLPSCRTSGCPALALSVLSPESFHASPTLFLTRIPPWPSVMSWFRRSWTAFTNIE